MATALTPVCEALTTNEIAANGGFTHRVVVTTDMLTMTGSDVAQSFTVFTPSAGDIIEKVGWRIKTFFEDASDAAFATTTVAIGDDSSVATHVSAIEVNRNGTEVRQGYGNTAVHYAAANTFKITFDTSSGKELVNLDIGELVVFFKLNRMAVLEEAINGTTLLGT